MDKTLRFHPLPRPLLLHLCLFFHLRWCRPAFFASRPQGTYDFRRSHQVYILREDSGMTLYGSQLLIQEVGTDDPGWVRCQPVVQISVGRGFGHVAQTWLPGPTTALIEIGTKGWYLKEWVKVERWGEPGSWKEKSIYASYPSSLYRWGHIGSERLIDRLKVIHKAWKQSWNLKPRSASLWSPLHHTTIPIYRQMQGIRPRVS